MNGERNLKITQLKKKIIWTKTLFGFKILFSGVYYRFFSMFFLVGSTPSFKYKTLTGRVARHVEGDGDGFKRCETGKFQLKYPWEGIFPTHKNVTFLVMTGTFFFFFGGGFRKPQHFPHWNYSSITFFFWGVVSQSYLEKKKITPFSGFSWQTNLHLRTLGRGER